MDKAFDQTDIDDADYLVIPDTNILLHYRFFDQLNWDELIGGDVLLVFPPILFRELDKRRSADPSRRVRDRAGSLFEAAKRTFQQLLPDSDPS